MNAGQGFLLAMVIMLGGCQPVASPAPNRADQQPSEAELPSARYQVAQPTLEQQDEQGRPIWKLTAKALQGQSGGKQAEGMLIDVRGWLYRHGKPVLQFTARYARAHSERKEVEAWGSVQAISRVSNARLQADRILWKAREDQIIASGRVVVQWGELVMRDNRLTLDTALQKAWGGE